MDYSDQQGIVWVLALVVFAIAVSIAFNQPKKKHEHLITTHKYGMGVKSYEVVYCLTDSMQVLRSGRHIETKNSREYFYGDNNN